MAGNHKLFRRKKPQTRHREKGGPVGYAAIPELELGMDGLSISGMEGVRCYICAKNLHNQRVTDMFVCNNKAVPREPWSLASDVLDNVLEQIAEGPKGALQVWEVSIVAVDKTGAEWLLARATSVAPGAKVPTDRVMPDESGKGVVVPMAPAAGLEKVPVKGNFDWKSGVRIGEASKPGPSDATRRRKERRQRAANGEGTEQMAAKYNVATSKQGKKAVAEMKKLGKNPPKSSPVKKSQPSPSSPAHLTAKPTTARRREDVSADTVFAHTLARNFSPDTLALLRQTLDPDGGKGQIGDAALRRQTRLVGVPSKTPVKCIPFVVETQVDIVVPPGDAFVCQGGLVMPALAADPTELSDPKYMYNLVTCVVDQPNVVLDYYETNAAAVEPVEYLNDTEEVGISDDALDNRLSTGTTNAFSATTVNTMQGSFVGGAQQPLPLTVPSGFDCLITAGGYLRASVQFGTNTNSLTMYGAALKRGRVDPDEFSDITTTGTVDANEEVTTYPSNQFMWPDPFVLVTPDLCADMPDFTFADTTAPYSNGLIATAPFMRALMVATGELGQFEAFNEDLFPCSEAPLQHVQLSGAMEKECGLKIRHPTFETNYTLAGLFGCQVPSPPTEAPVRGLNYANSISPEAASTLLLFGLNPSTNASLTITVSCVTYVAATYPSTMPAEFAPLWDPYVETALAMSAMHPVFSGPDSFWDFLKGAGKKVLDIVGSTAVDTGKKVLADLPGALGGLATRML